MTSREAAFGHNKKAKTERTPFCTLFLIALEDFMLRLLLVCAVISIAFEMGFADASHRKTGNNITIYIIYRAWIEGAAIFVAVFIVSFVGSFNDYKKEE